MEKEIEELKKEIEMLKKELEKRPTKEEIERIISEWAMHNIPMR